MLTQLHIRDLAIIEEVELSFGPGLTVLTGETGAGKSIIVGAAELLRGGRASAELVRSGCSQAVVEAVFDLADCPAAAAELRRAGIPLTDQDPELLVRRVIARNGRGRVHLNGSLGTVALLAEVGARLLDISGQHEYQALSDPASHRELVDALGVPRADLAAMAAAHDELDQLARQLARSRTDDSERAQRVDFLSFQHRELEAAGLAPAEDVVLEAERARLGRAAELLELATSGEGELYSSDGSVAERLARLSGRLEQLSSADPRLGPLGEQLEQARAQVEDVALALGRYGEDAELDPGRLEQVEQRLDIVSKLRRKHSCGSVDELLERQHALAAELDQLGDFDQQLEALEGRCEALRGEAERLAERITRARRRVGRKLARQVSATLQGLEMKGARLELQLGPSAARQGDEPLLCARGRRLSATGWDRVELAIASNPGEEARPLRQIASGGELSRIMLALRQQIGAHDPVATSIYDEVDAGIGGQVADVVGKALAGVAAHRQVLCVTHLPQVAAHADHHFHVGKVVRARRARTRAALLDPAARVEELARMLAGRRITAAARANARQLLEAAGAGARDG